MKHRKSEKKIKEESSLQKKASLTVESAFVLPFFFIAVVLIAGMLDLYRIFVLVQTSLCEGAKELGMYAYCSPEDTQSPVGIVNDGICAAYGSRKIRERLEGEALSGIKGGIKGIQLLGSNYRDDPVGIVNDGICAAYGSRKIRERLEGEALSGIKGGIKGIQLLGSNYRDDIVLLRASFFYHVPSGVFQIFPVFVKVEGQARAWKGFQGKLYGNSEDNEMVYITDWESVYHTSESCTHLNLSVEAVALWHAQSARNQYGERYHACESCIGQGTAHGMVYITSTGTAYHSNAQCGGIKRSVRMVKKSETEALHACERCGGRK